MRTPRALKDRLKRWFFLIHRLGVRAGVAVYPVHYYSSAADLIGLERTRSLWAKPSELPGLRVDLGRQVEYLRKVCSSYQVEYAGNRVYREAVKRRYGPGFGYVEAQALHAMIRYHRPSRIAEVGSGVSTACMAAALEKNQREGAGSRPSLVCIEPHPSAQLREMARTHGAVRLVEKPVQAVPMSLFKELSESDILFIDSSHIAKTGSDVNHLILEVLPKLNKGVLVHFHDIYFPYDYQRDLLRTFLHNNETSFLRAFLCFNSRFEILCCLSHLHYAHPQELKEIFPEYQPQSDRGGLCDERDERSGHFPSSCWLRVSV